MGSEDFPLTAWDNWTTKGTLPPAPPPTFEAWIEWTGGSRNHDPMAEATYALGAALRGVTHEGAQAAVQGCRNLLAHQREHGHVDQEAVTGYTGYHEGAAAAKAIAGRAWYELTGEPDLWLEAIGWWADHLAIWREIRMTDGQVLSVGARVHPTARDHASNAVFGVHLLDPLPHSDLVQWMRRLFTIDAGRGADRTGDLAAPGWDFRRYSWTRMILRARDSGALPPDVIQRLADGRRPRLIQPLYRWSADGMEHAAMPVVKGLGPRQWWCRWWPGNLEGEAWMRIDYPSGETPAPHGEPAPWLLEGRGPYESPTPIPIPGGLTPAFGPDGPIPPLPTLADLFVSPPPPPPPPEEEEPMPDTAFKLDPDDLKAADWEAVTGSDRRAALTLIRVLADRDDRAARVWGRLEPEILKARGEGKP